jgi:nitrate/TMAO reductase-like tetraheme cytochrome c subunit
MKICRSCNQERDLSLFSKDKNKKDGLRSNCKICCSKSHKNYRKNNKDKLLKHKYNISLNFYDNLFIQQNNRCAICSNAFSNEKHNYKAHIDHDHTTGKVRGLLCNDCNSGIGFLKENITILSNAIKYIEKHQD